MPARIFTREASLGIAGRGFSCGVTGVGVGAGVGTGALATTAVVD